LRAARGAGADVHRASGRGADDGSRTHGGRRAGAVHDLDVGGAGNHDDDLGADHFHLDVLVRPDHDFLVHVDVHDLDLDDDHIDDDDDHIDHVVHDDHVHDDHDDDDHDDHDDDRPAYDRAANDIVDDRGASAGDDRTARFRAGVDRLGRALAGADRRRARAVAGNGAQGGRVANRPSR